MGKEHVLEFNTKAGKLIANLSTMVAIAESYK